MDCGFVFSLVTCLWLTVAGLRVYRDPSCIDENSLLTGPVRWAYNRSQSSGLFPDLDAKFWASTTLVAAFAMGCVVVEFLLRAGS